MDKEGAASGGSDSPSILLGLMKTLFTFRRGFIWRIQSLLRPESVDEESVTAVGGRGESLFKLHETQNRVITSIYKISISGLVAIFLILLSFTLFMVSDPKTPVWVSYLLGAVELMLVVGFIRTLRDFRSYRKHFREVSSRLQQLLRQQMPQSGPAQSKGGAEHRLLSALKPKEYKGWDAKTCQQCEKSIELTVAVCQHCGHEQNQVLMI